MSDTAREEAEEWTPSTEQVRSHYVFNQSDRWDPERGKAFDRWLAAHDAAVRAASQQPAPEDVRRGEVFRVFEGERDRLERSEDLNVILKRIGVEEPTFEDLAAVTRWSDAHVSAGLDAILAVFDVRRKP